MPKDELDMIASYTARSEPRPTLCLRIAAWERYVAGVKKRIEELQQLWVYPDGKRKWQPVELVEIEDPGKSTVNKQEVTP